METPVLSKKQQKKTLSTKKPKKETIKNTLATPFARYWPVLVPEDIVTLHEALQSYLPRLAAPKVNIPWKDLKNVPKEKRKEFRQKYQPEVVDLDTSAKNYISFGVNEVTKSLEKGTTNAVLISNDVNPQLLVKHIVDMSVLRNTPLLIVPELRVVLKNCTGLSSVTIAIKNTAPTDSKLLLLVEKIKELHCNYPVPKEHINYQRSNKTNELISMTVESSISETNEISVTETNECCISKTMECDNETSEGAKAQTTGDLYLYRKDKSKRVFVPPSSSSGKNNNKQENTMEYLALDQSIEKPEVPKNVNYRSLIVKQLKGNKDRNKRKNDVMKKRRGKHKF